jgi:hypothetical protein
VGDFWARSALSGKLVSTGFSGVANFLPRAAVRGRGVGPEAAPGVRGPKSPPLASTAAGRIGTREGFVLSFCKASAKAVDGAIGWPWLFWISGNFSWNVGGGAGGAVRTTAARARTLAEGLWLRRSPVSETTRREDRFGTGKDSDVIRAELASRMMTESRTMCLCMGLAEIKVFWLTTVT